MHFNARWCLVLQTHYEHCFPSIRRLPFISATDAWMKLLEMKHNAISSDTFLLLLACKQNTNVFNETKRTFLAAEFRSKIFPNAFYKNPETNKKRKNFYFY